MLANHCKEDIVKDIFTNPLTYEADINTLKSSISECDFGIPLDDNLASSFVYYNWATLYEQKMSLLDPNESDAGFSFENSLKTFSKDQWNDGQLDLMTGVTFGKLSPYSATSVQLKQDALQLNSNASFVLLHVKGDNPFTPVVVTSTTNNSTHESHKKKQYTFTAELDKIITTQSDKTTTTEPNKTTQFFFRQNDLKSGSLITLANTNDKVVALDTFAFIESNVTMIKKEDWSNITQTEGEVEIEALSEHMIDKQPVEIQMEETKELLSEARCRERYIKIHSDELVNMIILENNISVFGGLVMNDQIIRNYGYDSEEDKYVSKDLSVNIVGMYPDTYDNDKSFTASYGIRRTNILSSIHDLNYCSNVGGSLDLISHIELQGNIANQFRDETKLAAYIDSIQIINHQSGVVYDTTVSDDGTWSQYIDVDWTLDSRVEVIGYNSSEPDKIIQINRINFIGYSSAQNVSSDSDEKFDIDGVPYIQIYRRGTQK